MMRQSAPTHQRHDELIAMRLLLCMAWHTSRRLLRVPAHTDTHAPLRASPALLEREAPLLKNLARGFCRAGAAPRLVN